MKSKGVEIIPSVQDIKRALNSSLAALERYEDEINRLNVFPVPDGDTGTNLLMTMKSVIKEVNQTEATSLASLAKAISYGSLMGARGNSGVILSQIIRGVCDVLVKRESVSPRVLVEALRNAKRIAYAAVRKPVEGTMLTIIKDAARAARKLSGEKLDLGELVEAVLAEANQSLLKTPDLLPVLKMAGVVDAGGRGLIILAEGLLAGVKGERMVDAFRPPAELLVPSIEETSLEYAYCTEFLLDGDTLNLEELEKSLTPFGDSLMVAGSAAMARVHIHTNDAKEVLKIARKKGNVSEIRINNMQEQAERYQETPLGALESKSIGIVAVASGEGTKRILRSLGVDAVVEGGQSMNPSTAEIVEALKKISSDKAIVMPNNKNVILAAQQAVGLTEKSAVVVPTTSVVQAFSAILEFSPEKKVEENLKVMEEAAARVTVGEVTQAIRDAQTPVGAIKKGDFLGLIDHQVRATGHASLKVCEELLAWMVNEKSQVATILYGADTNEEEANTLLKIINEKYPNLEVELHRGDQKVYSYIIGVE